MTYFNDAIEFTLKNEGGEKVSNHPNDPGGETKWGISQRFLNQNLKKGHQLFGIKAKDLTKEEAIALYWEFFWNNHNLDLLKSRLIAVKLFDIGVNIGMGTAIQLLQKAFNHCYSLSPLIVDGILGKNTAQMVNISPEMSIYNQFKACVVTHYEKIVERDEKKRVFLKGWLNRIAAPIPGHTDDTHTQ